jgi:hypothetical protein
MATAPSPPSRSRRQVRRADPPPRWRRWLLLGLFFGLGYGMTQRLLEVRWGGGANRPPAFRAKSPAGGTTLEELRRQHGNTTKPLTADLEALVREKRETKRQQDAAKRTDSERQKMETQEDTDLGDRERRLDDLAAPQEPASPEMAGERGTSPLTPAAPELPPPVLPPAEPPRAQPPATESRPGEGAPTPP